MAKDVFFVLSRAWDKEKILSPHEESNLRLMGTQNFFSVPRSGPDEKNEKNIFLCFFTELNLRCY